ncbi:sigma-70 family RNA polymerase sigma factor [Veillonella rogosae]|uniref:sigma-70 family RNA polymerase sigma factor n=1 Tax=Veillonella rogosae TaxID=423477 RepID=UPI000ACD6BBE|nr:sigma-70 family RNA polymerase sigma factor [Veillonella rogosae]
MKLSYLIPTTEYLTKEEEKALFEEYHKTPSLRRKKEIKEDLVLNQAGQIISIASIYKDADDIEDLFQEGMIAVLESFESYNYTKEASFTTYTRNGIFRQICYYLRRNKTIRLPAMAVEKLKKINKAKDLLTRLNKPITTDAISEITGIKEFNVIEILNSLTVEELDRLQNDGGEGETSRLSQIEDPTAEKALDQVLEDLTPPSIDLSSLTAREKAVIELFYYKEYSSNKIAKTLGIKPSAVHEAKSRALFKLRESMTKEKK